MINQINNRYTTTYRFGKLLLCNKRQIRNFKKCNK